MNEWLKNLLAFLIMVFGYGFIINVMFYGLRILNVFDILSVAAFGFLYYFVTEEILVWFRPRQAPKGEIEKTRGEKIAEKREDEKKADRESAMERLRKKIDAMKLTERKNK